MIEILRLVLYRINFCSSIIAKKNIEDKRKISVSFFRDFAEFLKYGRNKKNRMDEISGSFSDFETGLAIVLFLLKTRREIF